jgi:hypothetical protein
VQLGKLLRTAFLADYFVNAGFRRELRRVLNRGEAVNALKRAIYTGPCRAGPGPACDEMQAVADALSLLANIVMAWNTAQMQAVLDRWANRRQIVPPELTGRIAPTRLEGINLRGRLPLPAGALRRPDPAVTNCSENECWRLKSTTQTGAQRPIGRPTETQGVTSTCASRTGADPAPILALRGGTNRHFLH